MWNWDEDCVLSPDCCSSALLAFRRKVRLFVETEISPYVADWDLAGSIPSTLVPKAAAAGLYCPLWPVSMGGTPPQGMTASPDLIPYFDFIWQDEMARCGTSGLVMGGFISVQLGFPPVLTAGLAGGEHLTKKFATQVASGLKKVAFAVTEPYGGSDVAAIRTTADLSSDKSHFLLNGEKAFITGALSADFIVVAAKEGELGLTLFFVDAKASGVSMDRVATQGWCLSETTRVVFENVQVPLAMKVGESGKAFKYIMHNFNHERLIGCFGAARLARVCLEDATEYARNRWTFGKKLIDHQVIRHKLAEMARVVLANHALNMTLLKAFASLPQAQVAPLIALGKVHSTKNLEFVAREASQILGGKSFLRGDGPGGRIERIYREVRVLAIGGGSEEILIEFASRMI